MNFIFKKYYSQYYLNLNVVEIMNSQIIYHPYYCNTDKKYQQHHDRNHHHHQLDYDNHHSNDQHNYRFYNYLIFSIPDFLKVWNIKYSTVMLSYYYFLISTILHYSKMYLKLILCYFNFTQFCDISRSILSEILYIL